MTFEPQWSWWGILACSLGALSGVQGVIQKYPMDAGAAFKSWLAWLYVATRAAFPGGVFWLALATKTPELPAPALAFSSGLAWEVVLRSQFFIAKTTDGADIQKGFFDLVLWYQSLFLKGVDVRVAQERLDWINKHLPKFATLQDMIQRIETNIGTIPESTVQREVRDRIAEYIASAPNGTIPDQQRKLAFAIRNIVGNPMFRNLVR